MTTTRRAVLRTALYAVVGGVIGGLAVSGLYVVLNANADAPTPGPRAIAAATAAPTLTATLPTAADIESLIADHAWAHGVYVDVEPTPDGAQFSVHVTVYAGDAQRIGDDLIAAARDAYGDTFRAVVLRTPDAVVIGQSQPGDDTVDLAHDYVADDLDGFSYDLTFLAVVGWWTDADDDTRADTCTAFDALPDDAFVDAINADLDPSQRLHHDALIDFFNANC